MGRSLVPIFACCSITADSHPVNDQKAWESAKLGWAHALSESASAQRIGEMRFGWLLYTCVSIVGKVTVSMGRMKHPPGVSRLV